MKVQHPLSRLGACLILAAVLACLIPRSPAAEGTLVRINNIAQAVSTPLVTNVTTSVITLFSTNTAEFNGRVMLRTVQNVSTIPVLYLINSTNVTTANFHGVLPGGLNTRDGLGGVLDLSNIPYPVSFRTETGTCTLSVVELTQ